MNKLYPLLAFAFIANMAYADDSTYRSEAKLSDSQASTWNVGAGFTRNMIHLNTEWGN